jgi:hypothetical protein
VHGKLGAGSTLADNLNIQMTEGIDTFGDALGSSDTTWQPSDAERTNAARYKIASYLDYRNSGNSVDFVAWILKTPNGGDPVALGLKITPECINASSSHWFIATPDGSSDLPGHAVFVYGYDHRGLLIENQWGLGWANNGYAELSWDYVLVDCLEVASIVPKAPPPAWRQLPGAATDLSVGNDGSVWGLGITHVDGGYDIYHWDAAA